MMQYPVILQLDPPGYFVQFPDIPEALTCGKDREDALDLALDAVVTAFEFYFEDRRAIPLPSPIADDFVTIPASVTAKVLLLNEVVKQGVSNVELARRAGIRPQEVTRLFDLRHSTKIDTIQKALAALGKRLEVVVG